MEATAVAAAHTLTPSGKIDPPEWMAAEATGAVVAALTVRGTEVRFVGGCVRDALAGRAVTDIDIATPDPPEAVIELLGEAGLKAIPTGLAHGTVTAVAGDRHFEITTLREDVETDGRRARVAFSDDWLVDAERRDFTINALSCRPDGSYFDPFGGMVDLAAGRVRFVGDPRARIEEDYLRLLRFFRFHAHYGRGAPDAAGLAAAKDLASGLAILSGERLRAEILRLLAADDPLSAVRAMLAAGVLQKIVPDVVDPGPLARLVELEAAGADPLRRLAALLPLDPTIAEKLADRLRLSVAERDRLAALTDPEEDLTAVRDPRALRVALYRRGRDRIRDRLLLDWARGDNSDGATLDAFLEQAEAWAGMRFPLSGRDVIALGLEPGPEVGRLLSRVEAWWIERDFRPGREACIEQLRTAAGAGQAKAT